jgi:hypothetical protein
VLSAETFRRDGDADADWEAPFGPVISSRGLPGIAVPRLFYRTIAQPRRRVQPLGPRTPAPLFSSGVWSRPSLLRCQRD